MHADRSIGAARAPRAIPRVLGGVLLPALVLLLVSAAPAAADPAPPSIRTRVSATSINLGREVTDTATVSGVTPSNNAVVVFEAYGPNDVDCANGFVFSQTIGAFNGDGNYTTEPFRPPSAGTYQFVARYEGAGESVSGVCNDADETVEVSGVTMATEVSSPSLTLGRQVTDTATIGNTSPNGSGTITFNAYGPDDADCSGGPINTSTVGAFNGNGSYTSDPFMFTSAGTYRFIASYSTGGSPVSTGACNDANETVEMLPSITGRITSQVSAPSVPVGTAFSDTATLHNLWNPPGGGRIIFNVYGPDDGTCTGTIRFTSTTNWVNGQLTYTSAPFTPTTAGTYRWVTSFSGDANNHAFSGGCNDADENVVVSKLPVRMTAMPAVLQLSPLALPLLRLQVTLVRASDGAPLGGQTIRFTAGSKVLCQAVTNAKGTAVCDAVASALDVVLSLGYTASFDGSATYLAKTVNGPLVK